MIGAVGPSKCCSQLAVHRSALPTSPHRLSAASQVSGRASRRERLCVCAKKKQRQAPRAAKTETEKKPATLEQQVGEAEVPNEPLEVSTPSSSPEEEPQPVVQEVKLSISPEDLKDLKAAMQNKPRGAVQDPGLIAGILEEVRLISWPDPLQALSDTFVVIAIVSGTAVTLFFVNSVLAEISSRIY